MPMEIGTWHRLHRVNAFVAAADGQRLDEMVRAVIEIMRRVDFAAVAAGFLDAPFFGEH